MQKYIDILFRHGADAAVEISAGSLVIAPWTVMKCRYGCPSYGHNRCCPPFTPDYAAMQSISGCYSRALLFRCREMSAATPAATSCARALVADGYYKSLAFGVGPCKLCERCTPDACPRPWDTAPSMEACGIDVIATVRAAGFDIDIPPRPDGEASFFGLILVD